MLAIKWFPLQFRQLVCLCLVKFLSFIPLFSLFSHPGCPCSRYVWAADPPMAKLFWHSTECSVLWPPAQRGTAMSSKWPVWHLLQGLSEGVPGSCGTHGHMYIWYWHNAGPRWELPQHPSSRARSRPDRHPIQIRLAGQSDFIVSSCYELHRASAGHTTWTLLRDFLRAENCLGDVRLCLLYISVTVPMVGCLKVNY